jgi:signal transduction histidine kinase
MEDPSSISHDCPLDYEVVFRQLPGLFVVLTPDFRIAQVSDALLAATHSQREEILGRSVFEAFPDNPDDPDATGTTHLRASLQRVLRTRKTDTMPFQRYDIPLPGGGFEERYWSPVSAPLLDDQGAVRFIIHRSEDVTELVRQRQQNDQRQHVVNDLQQHRDRLQADLFARSLALQQAKEDLERSNADLQEAERTLRTLNEELAASNEELAAMNEQLKQQADRLHAALAHERELREVKNRFVSMVTHELRTPLTMVGFAADFLRKHRHRMTDEAVNEKLETISRQVIHLSGFLEEVLAIGRADAQVQQLVRQPVPVHSFFTTLRQELETSHGGTHTIRLTVPSEGTWVTDPGALRSICLNLVSNAIKYSPQAREVGWTVNCVAGGWEMRVRDFGIGIPPEFLPDLFLPWKRANNTTHITGTGLGLYITRQLVEALHGSLSVNSDLEQGTEFTVRLPG